MSIAAEFCTVQLRTIAQLCWNIIILCASAAIFRSTFLFIGWLVIRDFTVAMNHTGAHTLGDVVCRCVDTEQGLCCQLSKVHTR